MSPRLLALLAPPLVQDGEFTAGDNVITVSQHDAVGTDGPPFGWDI